MNESDRRSSPQVPDAARTDDPMNFANWARAAAPHLDELSNSNPNARLLEHNLIAITDDTETARSIALDFERTTGGDTDTSMLVLGHPENRESKHQADPEGVTTHAAKRSLLGGLPGAVIFALVIGVGVWLVTDSLPATFGAAVGAAMFGFFSIATWSYVMGTGQSRAFQQSFIDPDAADAIIVAFHTHDRSLMDDARQAVGHADDVRLYEVDARGKIRS